MLRSMTAFARLEQHGDWGDAVCEIRAVNHRYLDISLRLPEELRSLEPELRKLISNKVKRGKIDCTVRFKSGDALGRRVAIDNTLVDALVDAATDLVKDNKVQGALSIEQVLVWPGVATLVEDKVDMAFSPIKELFDNTIDSLVSMREQEGQGLQGILLEKLESIREELKRAKIFYDESKGRCHDKLKERFANLALTVDSDRLEQELVLILQKMDVTEELDRLVTHIGEVENILNSGGVSGRRLDFLMQELNREANTLASKSQDAGLTQVSVELKVLIEQMREQVQNIE